MIVLHDLNLAARYADHLVAMRAGRVRRRGHPAEVLTEDCRRTVFGLDGRVIADPISGTPLVVPSGGTTRRRRWPRAGQPEAA